MKNSTVKTKSKPFKLITSEFTNCQKYYWFTINSTNNQILATSETYATKQSALKAIRSILKRLHIFNANASNKTIMMLYVFEVVQDIPQSNSFKNKQWKNLNG